ncbi:MAG TPA: flagellin, partial [Gemmatimonadaceae bacterium]|nr:flagellin [Gemmatimonadaceae bacterium]
MRINTNISAMNASRNLWSTQQSIDSSMSKLSSGFRINRAADDAAGLGISNKLRADIRSMGQASRNAEQANSLLQIAEGSVGTIQKMLERMKELATQAGSDTVDAGGRTRIQEEFKALQNEITRTVDTTKFQGTALLKGAVSSPAVVAANAVVGTNGTTGNAAFASTNFTAAKGTGDFTFVDDGAGTITVSNGTLTDTFTVVNAKAGVVTGANTGIAFQLATDYGPAVSAANAVVGTDGASANAAFDSIDFTAAKGTGSFTIVDDGAGNLTVSNGTLTDTFLEADAIAGVVTGTNTGIAFQLVSGYSSGDLAAVAAADQTTAITTAAVAGSAGNELASTAGSSQTVAITTAAVASAPAVVGTSQSFLVSSSAEYAGADAVTINSFNLQLTTLGIDADDLSTSAGAITALTNLDAAMGVVSQTLGTIGASQNRIDYAQQNIKVAI